MLCRVKNNVVRVVREALYKQHCQECHLPALTPSVARGDAPGDPFGGSFKPVTWLDRDEVKTSHASLLDVNIVGQDYLGTDPAQGEVLALRTINTAGDTERRALGINTTVYTTESGYPGKKGESKLNMVNIYDDPLLSYALALGAVVQLAIEE